MRTIATAVAFGLILVSSLAAQAADPSVEITSFHYSETNFNSHVAEVCGLVKDAATSPTFVKVTVDPKSKHPGIYNVIAGKDGHFCVTVTTYYGIADAELL